MVAVASKDLFNAAAASADSEVMDTSYLGTKAILVKTAGFSGTLDVQGSFPGDNTWRNVGYRRRTLTGGAHMGAASEAQMSFTTDTGVYLLVVTEPWPRLRLSMTRSAGTISAHLHGTELPFPDAGALKSSTAIVVAASNAPAAVKAGADYVCDGTADQVEIAAAIAAAATGGVVELSEGEFTVASAIAVNKTLTLRGQGPGSTKIIPTFNGNVLTFNQSQTTKVYNLRVTGLHISPATNRTSGAAVVVGNVGNSYFDLKVSAGQGGTPYVGLLVENASMCRYQLDITGCASDAVQFSPNATAQASCIDNFFLDGSYIAGNVGWGFNITNTSTTYTVEGVYLNGCDIYDNDAGGVRVHPSASTTVKNIILNNCIIDSNGTRGIYVEGAAVVRRVFVNNCWVGNNQNGPGIYFTAFAQHCKVNGGFFTTNLHNGITIDNADHIQIEGAKFSNNSQFGTNTFYAIEVKTTATNITIEGCDIDNESTFAWQQNGIKIDSGCTDVSVLDTRIITGASSTPWNDSGTRTVAQNVLQGTTAATATVLNTRPAGYKGADVASANDITLGAGTFFSVTGTTQVNRITTTGFQPGSIITLQFAASLTVSHNTANSGALAGILLAGAANFSATANDTLTLLYNGTNWVELARAVI